MDDDYQTNDLKSDTIDIARYINRLARAASNPHNDGFTQCSCKHDLYMLKCLIEDLYKELPDFPQQEKEWEQARIVEILKK